MNKELKVCALNDCETEFKPKVKTQRYCSPRCSYIAQYRKREERAAKIRKAKVK